MNIELRNVKTVAWMSEDSTCFNATVYVNGEKAFIASDDGHGGCIDFDPINARGAELLAQVEEWVKTLPPHRWEGIRHEIPITVGLYIGELLAKYLSTKEYKNASRNKTVFRKSDQSEGQYTTVGNKNTTRAQEVAWVRKNYPDAKIFNPVTCQWE